MIETVSRSDIQIRRELVGRVVSSSVIYKSARLRDMFLYLCRRALEDPVDDIHELELGHQVFGRAESYDTSADNIVRVHASLLRKRLAEYFQTEGANEPLIVEIPRGNYAPIFRKRDVPISVLDLPGASETLVSEPRSTLLEPSEAPVPAFVGTPSRPRLNPAWKLWALGSLALGFASLSVFLSVRGRNQFAVGAQNPPLAGAAVRQFWSGIFAQGAPTQMVLDDASLDFYQEATGHTVALAEYFDRSYLHPMEEATAAHLDPKLVHAFLSRRQSNFADVNLVGSLSQTAIAAGSGSTIQFARDFSFRQVKAGNVILLGSRQSNPWIQPFDSYLAVRWKYDPALESYYPSDTTNPAEPDKFRARPEVGKTHDGFASVAFLPNMGGTGNVLIISGSGGAAIGAALAFLINEPSMEQLRSRLNPAKKGVFPYFETLLRVEKVSGLSRFGTIVLCRPPLPLSPAGVQTAGTDSHR